MTCLGDQEQMRVFKSNFHKTVMQSKVGKESSEAIGDAISYTRLKDLNFI